MAGMRVDAAAAFGHCVASDRRKDGKAVARPGKDPAELVTVSDVPVEPWRPIRTPHPVASVLATVCNRTCRTRGGLRRRTALVRVCKRVLAARTRWNRLAGSERLAAVIEGMALRDGRRQRKDGA